MQSSRAIQAYHRLEASRIAMANSTPLPAEFTAPKTTGISGRERRTQPIVATLRRMQNPRSASPPSIIALVEGSGVIVETGKKRR
jgi:hypothetical protein